MNIEDHNSFAYHSRTGGPPTIQLFLARAGLSIGAFLLDVLSITISSCAIGITYHTIVYNDHGSIKEFLAVGVTAALIFSLSRMLRGDYDASGLISTRFDFWPAARLWTLTFALVLGLGFITKTEQMMSRGSVLLFYVFTFPVLLVVHTSVGKLVSLASRAGLISLRKVFLFGSAADIQALLKVCDIRSSGIVITGCHFVTPMPDNATLGERHLQLQLDIKSAIASMRTLVPDIVVLMLPWSNGDLIEACVGAFTAIPADLHLGPDHVLRRFVDVKWSRIGTFVSLQIKRVPLSPFDIAIKRVIDISGACLAVACLTPLLIFVAALIKLDSSGPVFFLQRRYGLNQQAFRIIKFRTMHTLDDGAIIRQATQNDPRVTRVGKWLRRFNIDELPQLFNVIMGDMSLVGPRPHAVAHDEHFGNEIAIYARRHKVRPGITGWAQINGFRGETSTVEKMQKRVDLDLYYIEHWSLMLDLKILFRTAFSLQSYHNAY